MDGWDFATRIENSMLANTPSVNQSKANKLPEPLADPCTSCHLPKFKLPISLDLVTAIQAAAAMQAPPQPQLMAALLQTTTAYQ